MEDIRFMPGYFPIGKPAEHAHGNWQQYPFVDANSVGGVNRVLVLSDILNISDNILRNIGYTVLVIATGKSYRLIDWEKKNQYDGWAELTFLENVLDPLNPEIPVNPSNPYNLPIAGYGPLGPIGGVMIGGGLQISPAGVLSVADMDPSVVIVEHDLTPNRTGDFTFSLPPQLTSGGSYSLYYAGQRIDNINYTINWTTRVLTVLFDEMPLFTMGRKLILVEGNEAIATIPKTSYTQLGISQVALTGGLQVDSNGVISVDWSQMPDIECDPEIDPVFLTSAAYGITNTMIGNWTSAYNWGDHSVEGYLKTIPGNLVTTDTNQNITAIKTFPHTMPNFFEIEIGQGFLKATNLTPINVSQTPIEIVLYGRGISCLEQGGNFLGSNNPKPMVMDTAGFFGVGTTAVSEVNAGKMVVLDPVTNKIKSSLLDNLQLVERELTDTDQEFYENRVQALSNQPGNENILFIFEEED